jgi:hypothetical protein
MDDREFLEKHVSSFAIEDHRLCCGAGSWRWVIEPTASGWATTESEAFSLARAWLKARLKEIAEVEEEIAELEDDVQVWSVEPQDEDDKRLHAVYRRILSREQSVLAALKFGMREE